MTYREVDYLTKTKEFRTFVNKYRLNFLQDNNIIYLLSECYLLEIYGLGVEEHFYFEIYSKDYKFYSNVDRLLAGTDRDRIKSISQRQINLRVVPIAAANNNPQRTLKAEQFFFGYLSIMDELLSDFLLCKFNLGDENFTSTPLVKQTQLVNILNNLKFN
jgi:hypothetical protein